jgi:hypothetical protein
MSTSESLTSDTRCPSVHGGTTRHAPRIGELRQQPSRADPCVDRVVDRRVGSG